MTLRIYHFYLVNSEGITSHSCPLNVLVPMTLIAAGMTFAWPHARTQTSPIVIAAALHGIYIHSVVSGTYVSTFPLPIFALARFADVGRRTGWRSLSLHLRARRYPGPFRSF
ncbi:hypothetical protein B0H13DRAFT_832267 [Mycena leptocephala]|nr:hypothetical protein B0H13DRAFT_832267 [Mycena leptocephala]